MAPLIMNLQQLISETSNVSADEEFPQHMQGIPDDTTRLFWEELIDGIQDEVNISIITPEIGLQGRVVGKGLGLVLKNVLKYFSD